MTVKKISTVHRALTQMEDQVEVPKLAVAASREVPLTSNENYNPTAKPLMPELPAQSLICIVAGNKYE